MKTDDPTVPPKIGIIASRRFGGAVSRSQAKRRIREIFRRNKTHFPTGINLVVLPRSGISGVTFSSLEKHFVEAVEKLSS